MFHAARIKLTAWYLLIIMLVSASFSVIVYKALTFELNRVEHLHRLRQERLGTVQNLIPQLRGPLLERYRLLEIDQELIRETKNRLVLRLLGINAAIFALAAAAGYFLAGRTLRPIADMVDQQNRFITDASHELRTTLTALRTELEVSLMDK